MNIGTYQEKHEKTIQNLDKTMDTIEKSNSEYIYRNLKLQKEMVKIISFQELHYHRPAAQMIVYISTNGLVFIGALIIVGISTVFTQEWATGVDQYMLSSKFGRKTIVHAR
ncbi:hypothetical protein JSQ81_01020 [Sporosarcina sp. Marseille-Q4063]|uniref:hypothetical protein n=1 Tax=Sporosarcina sp. Marseille-Q4063 TaxID=2810514 RepID=UPI001BAF3E51|nr:hypothetical protein [Sporosarcina sp. Marseille-Q4063]QUW22208.1 hypothetical protein JSQ81_01020 [Sporosarcina sp. Marseille-Q4063]